MTEMRIILLAGASALATWTSAAAAQSAPSPSGEERAATTRSSLVVAQSNADSVKAAGTTDESEAEGPDDLPAGEIVVTARRRTERLQDVPVSVSVIGGQALERSNIQSLDAVASRVSNVRIGPGPLSDLINIRGVGSSLNLGFEQSVGTFVDGVYRPRSRAIRTALFDVDQVEILKGPQTTFFGNNTIAGAFNITTKKPGDRFEANASGFYAPNTEEYTVEGGVTLPLTQQLSMRIAGRANGMDGYIKNIYLDDMSPRTREKIGRVSLAWTPTSDITTNARIDIGRMRNDGIWSTQLISCPPPPEFLPRAVVCNRYLATAGGNVDDKLDGVSETAGSFFNYDYLEAAQTTTVGIGENSLVLTTGYFDHSYKLLNDVLPVPPNQGGSLFNTTQSLPDLIYEDFNLFSQEVRLQSAPDLPIEYMAGLYFYTSDLDATTYQGQFFLPFGAFAPGFFSPTDKIAFRIRNREKNDTYSAFASVTVKILPSFRLNLGARYSIVEKTAHRLTELGTVAGSLPNPDDFTTGPAGGQAILLPISGVEPGEFDRTSRTDKKFMPTASIKYDVTRNVMAYLSYAKGFKAGGFAGYSGKSIFEPETVDAFEGGMKSTFLNGRAMLNIAAFYSNYENLQETTTIFTELGTTRQIVGNVAKSTSKGVELSSRFTLAEGFVLSADVAYLDARYKDYVNAPCTASQSLFANPCTQDLSGKRRAFAPEWNGNVAIAVDRPLTDSLRFRLDANMYFTSWFYQQPIADKNLSQPEYAKFDLRIALGPENRKWEVAVVGKNLTDKRTASFRQNIASPGSFQFLEEAGRSVGFQLSWRH